MDHNTPSHSFLTYVLEDLQSKEIDLLSCIYVLPSKRSGTFLKKHLARTLHQNSFTPKIIAIQDYIAEIAGLTPASSVELLLYLYEAHQAIAKENQEDFYTFLKWAPRLIQDFNEIDAFLVPTKKLFKEVFAIQKLHHWGIAEDKTTLIENYLKFWNQLEPLYTAFTTRLLKQKKGYSGLLYRTAVNYLESYCDKQANAPVIFIGFNALNRAESQIIQHYLEQGNGEVYWDIDTYFLNDPVHEAGFFIRKYLRQWPYYKKHPLLGIHDSFRLPKNISIIGVPKNIAQTKYAGQLLEKIGAQSLASLEKTALILADESLLRPMLSAIPATVPNANITMGMRLDKTVLYTFFSDFLQLISNQTERGWFYRDVLALLANPYTVKLSQDRGDFALDLVQSIKSNHWLYLNTVLISPYIAQSPLVSLLFPKTMPKPLQCIEAALVFIEHLKRTFQEENNKLELEYLYRFYRIFLELKTHVSNSGVITELKTLKYLFDNLLAVETLNFIGEPLMGLQIMGMLESRNLDFETIILTSANEGILPAGKSNSSFIPFEVKRAYGLPTYKEQDAIYTYHFYRLIQRAKTVYLLYNTEPDVLEGGEKSRLLSQLLTDEAMSPYITHKTASPRVSLNPITEGCIPKSQELLKDLKAMASRGFSPTSLTNYIRNPLEFYTRNILNINDINEVEESIAANTFGTIVHDSLEELYMPLVGKMLTRDGISALQPQIPTIVRRHFQEKLSGIDCTQGRYFLVYHVIVTYLRRFVAHEIQLLTKHQIKLLALETKYQVPLAIPELDFPVYLKGTLDRVDEVDGILRILDYKTGRVEPRHVKLSDWETLIQDYDKSKAFQLLCYAFLYHQHQRPDILKAEIYSFKNSKQGFLPFTIGKNDSSIDGNTLATFEIYLKRLIIDICDSRIPFKKGS